MFLGIEIGGTKLQLGLGPGDGTLAGLWRGRVDPAGGAAGIRGQILAAIPELCASHGVARSQLHAVGIGFGGPVDDRRRCVIKSHQIAGWDAFPIVEWMQKEAGLSAILGNDADFAALAESRFGAGRGFDPVFYVTIGSGIGGGLILNGRIHRGCGVGAAEIGHLQMRPGATLEDLCSGWAIESKAGIPMPELARQYCAGDVHARDVLHEAWNHLADALCHVVALICPARIVIGGGVSLVGDVLFEPLRQMVSARVFRPFTGCYEIVPAALGEQVVVHGALAAAGAISP